MRKGPIVLVFAMLRASACLWFVLISMPPAEAAKIVADARPLDVAPGTADRDVNTTAQNFVDRGKKAYQERDYKTAIEQYSEALKLKPSDARLFYNRGLAYYKSEALEPALADFTEALNLAPSLYFAFMNRGNIYSRLDRFADAVADYDKAIAIKPDDFLIWFNRGVAHGRLGNTETALQDLNEALRLNPYDGPSYSARADLYFAQGDKERAAADYQRVLVITPGAQRATERLAAIKSNQAEHSVDGIIVQDRTEQRKVDHDVISVAVNGCFAEGDTEIDLTERATRSGWSPVGSEELKKQSSAANSMTGGWTFQGADGPVAVIQSRENVTPPVRVCSITTKLPPALRFDDMQSALEAALRTEPSEQSERGDQITRGYWVPHTPGCTARVSLVFSSTQRVLTIRMLHGRGGTAPEVKPDYPRDEGW